MMLPKGAAATAPGPGAEHYRTACQHLVRKCSVSKAATTDGPYLNALHKSQFKRRRNCWKASVMGGAIKKWQE